MSVLYAFSRVSNALVVKRVPLTAGAQVTVNRVFNSQYGEFVSGIDEEIEYSGNYTPSDDEILYVDDLPEIRIIADALEGNATALEPVDHNALYAERVKALCVKSGQRVLIQKFGRTQVLEKSRAFAARFVGGDSLFAPVESDIFSLATSLSAVIEHGRLKFYRENSVRGFVQLSQIFRESTDNEVREFITSGIFASTDVDELLPRLGTMNRKRIFSITNAGHLNEDGVQKIVQACQASDFDVEVSADDKIVLPREKADLTTLFRIVDDKIYRGSISQRLFYTNSSRAI